MGFDALLALDNPKHHIEAIQVLHLHRLLKSIQFPGIVVGEALVTTSRRACGSGPIEKEVTATSPRTKLPRRFRGGLRLRCQLQEDEGGGGCHHITIPPPPSLSLGLSVVILSRYVSIPQVLE
ncbi:Os09g0277600 [Oryza sativa Japonica Group]|uniref:Os09g0277600 protein n=1 Tax=Oryza sativa subsp. japonica TaxID=39947 RepID=A0A0P0XKE9_ORYSJ|nr:Os09g0277600 [Oryza sativa Japonica Group]